MDVAGWLHGYLSPEFSEALSRAKAYRAIWWEDQARRVARQGGPGGQSMMIVFALKNLASEDWRDRFEHTGADGGPINLEALLLRAEEKRGERLVKMIEHEPKPSNEQNAHYGDGAQQPDG